MSQKERDELNKSDQSHPSGKPDGTIVRVPQDEAEQVEVAIEMFEALTGELMSDQAKNELRSRFDVPTK